MKVSIFTPTGKFFLSMGRTAINSVLDGAASRNVGNVQARDAIFAAKAAVNGALDALLAM